MQHICPTTLDATRHELAKTTPVETLGRICGVGLTTVPMRGGKSDIQFRAPMTDLARPHGELGDFPFLDKQMQEGAPRAEAPSRSGYDDIRGRCRSVAPTRQNSDAFVMPPFALALIFSHTLSS